MRCISKTISLLCAEDRIVGAVKIGKTWLSLKTAEDQVDRRFKGVKKMINILIVEDDIALCDGICAALKSNDNNIFKAHRISEGAEYFSKQVFDLIILDVNLPDGTGLDFLKTIKKQTGTPVILLTANDLESDIVTGLESGADDYITKPFSLAVLRARVNTQLRNRKKSTVFIQDEFVFDFDKLEYFVSKKQIELSKTEQKLLKTLTDNKGITLQRAVLVDRIWTDGSEYVDENALSVTVKRLRAKLRGTDKIKTVYGIGYTWVV